MTAISTVYAVGLALCLFSGGILNGRVRAEASRVSFFALYFGLEGLCFLLEILVSLPTTPFKALWLSLLMTTSLLIAPVLWLALLQAMGKRPSLSQISLRQRLLIVLGAAMTIPLLATMHSGTDFVNPDRVGSTLLQPLVHETMVGCLFLFAIQVPIYLQRCRRLLIAADSARAQRWLQLPLAIVGVTWALGVIRTGVGVASAGSQPFFAAIALTDVSVTILCAYLIMKALAGEASPKASNGIVSTASGSTECKYEKSQLSAQVRARIRRKIETAFVVDHIHRDPGLKLAALSRAVNESEHYVSQVINQDLETTFYDLVARHRIEHAKQLLLRSPELSVLQVAMAVGFNAKSTFNNAFRRFTGHTPREYRATAAPQDHEPYARAD